MSETTCQAAIRKLRLLLRDYPDDKETRDTIIPALMLLDATRIRAIEFITNYKDALEEIEDMGCSQPAVLNMPEADWNFRLFNHCQRIARKALEDKDYP